MSKTDYWCYFAWCREYMKLEKIARDCNIPCGCVDAFIEGNMEAMTYEQLTVLYDSIQVITKALETIA